MKPVRIVLTTVSLFYHIFNSLGKDILRFMNKVLRELSHIHSLCYLCYFCVAERNSYNTEHTAWKVQFTLWIKLEILSVNNFLIFYLKNLKTPYIMGLCNYKVNFLLMETTVNGSSFTFHIFT